MVGVVTDDFTSKYVQEFHTNQTPGVHHVSLSQLQHYKMLHTWCCGCCASSLFSELKFQLSADNLYSI